MRRAPIRQHQHGRQFHSGLRFEDQFFTVPVAASHGRHTAPRGRSCYRYKPDSLRYGGAQFLNLMDPQCLAARRHFFGSFAIQGLHRLATERVSQLPGRRDGQHCRRLRIHWLLNPAGGRQCEVALQPAISSFAARLRPAVHVIEFEIARRLGSPHNAVDALLLLRHRTRPGNREEVSSGRCEQHRLGRGSDQEVAQVPSSGNESWKILLRVLRAGVLPKPLPGGHETRNDAHAEARLQRHQVRRLHASARVPSNPDALCVYVFAC